MTNESYPEKIGRYQILSLLGEGAMAKVFKAVDTRIDRVVALKMLQFREGMTDEMIQQLKDRFVHEAKFAGKLTHPNIVTIYDAEEENGVSYMAMEYVDGRTLESVIENNETLTVEQILDILIQLAHGLDYAHKHDIIHRDIKPGNIILTSEDIPKIMDFGIAKITTSSTTVIGTILGTPGYMSPEQITGKSVDHRTDIFALGAVFYELLTREKAFPGKNLTEIMYRVVSENPMPPSMVNLNVPEIINPIVMRAIAKGPGERYQSGTEFAKALEVTKIYSVAGMLPAE
ncbi:MAG TPA: serine/threonine-protein kinase, partial [bacterium]|nr:serine/threonine-protein kinase [bacterium]